MSDGSINNLDGAPNRSLTQQEILQRSFDGDKLALRLSLGDLLPPSPDSPFNKYDITFTHWDDGSFKQDQPRTATYVDIVTGSTVATLSIDYEQLTSGEVAILSTTWS